MLHDEKQHLCKIIILHISLNKRPSTSIRVYSHIFCSSVFFSSHFYHKSICNHTAIFCSPHLNSHCSSTAGSPSDVPRRSLPVAPPDGANRICHLTGRRYRRTETWVKLDIFWEQRMDANTATWREGLVFCSSEVPYKRAKGN